MCGYLRVHQHRRGLEVTRWAPHAPQVADVVAMPLLAVSAQLRPGRICIKPVTEDEYISVSIRWNGCWEEAILTSILLAMLMFPNATFLGTQ